MQKHNNKNKILIEDIRKSVRRLCEMQEIDLNNFNIKDTIFNKSITNFQSKQIKSDIQQQKLILTNDFDLLISPKLNFLKKKLNEIKLNTTIQSNIQTNNKEQLKSCNEIYQQISSSTTNNSKTNNDSAISKTKNSERLVSSKSITPISSERFKYEIDNIGARLSKIRESLYVNKKNLIENIEKTESVLSLAKINIKSPKSNIENNNNSLPNLNIEKISIVSADSACCYLSNSKANKIQENKKLKIENSLSTKNISLIRKIERLDLSQLNTFQESEKLLNSNWTNIKINSKLNQQQRHQKIKKKNLNNLNFIQKHKNQTLSKKTFDLLLFNQNNKNKSVNITNKFPKWLTLVPNTAIDEILTKKINKKNFKYEFETINKQNILQLQLKNKAFTIFQLNNINNKKKDSSNFLFLCDMSQSQIDYLLKKNI